jgi:hypothetical protein
MTREEAICELSVIWERLSHPEDCENGCYSFRDGNYTEALDMAIEALSTLSGDIISKADVMGAVAKLDRYDVDERNRLRAYTPFHGTEAQTFIDVVDLYQALEVLPSADAVPKSEQYKKGFEDAKRALELEYARESENMRKRIAGLEVLLNAREAIAEANSVVRCKDCCHRVHDEERGLYYCEKYYGQGDVSDENFCQWGERR